MQLLFEGSDEDNVTCLGLIEGRVRKLDPAPDRPVPHMGWSRIALLADDLGVRSGDYLYFAHGYVCDSSPATLATVSYGHDLPVIVRKGNWLGAQFHPERSAEAGARFLKSFVA
jgi:glutamine amidotransferase